jgi:glycosyltransferase involved in cell wall biosynthesis
MRCVLRRADAVIAVAPAEVPLRTADANGRGLPIHVIPNGVPGELFPLREPTRSENEVWKVLFVGQLTERKGIYVLVDALRRLTLQYRVSLHLVSHITPEETPLREALGGIRNLDVQFRGAKSAAELAVVYADSHVVVLPSLSEALPSVLTEAMLVGRPIVASDVGGIREQVGRAGLLVPPGDAGALAEALEETFCCYQDRTAAALAAAGRARSEFSVSTMIDRHLNVYASVADAGKASTLPSRAGAAVGREVARAVVALRP